MKKQYKVCVVSLMAVGCMLVASQSFSQSMKSKGKGKRGQVSEEMKVKFKEKMMQKFDEMAEKLDLTEEQKAKLLEGKEKHFEEMKVGRQAVQKKKKELSRELEKDILNMEKIYQINSELKVLHAKQQDQMLQKILDVRQILTPVQFGKFSVLMEDGKRGRREKFQKKRGRMMGKKGFSENSMDERHFPSSSEME